MAEIHHGIAAYNDCISKAHDSTIKWNAAGEQYITMFTNASSMQSNWYGTPAPTVKAKTLMFGDSINRFVVDDTCATLNGVMSTWANDQFVYKAGSSANAVCISDRGVIAFLHVYGSSLRGPYLHGHSNSVDDPYTDTELRIVRGLHFFLAEFGIPTLVTYRAELWDAHVTYKEPFHKHDDIISRFVNDTITIFQTLQMALPSSVLLGTHTIPITTWGGVLHLKYSSALRYIAKFLDILIIDWQHLVSDSGKTRFLRDKHHPTPELCSAIGNLLLDVANGLQNKIEACNKTGF